MDSTEYCGYGTSMRVALLGDSIFDNAAYVGGGTDVAGHLRSLLAEGDAVDLLARDGSRIGNIGSQLSRVANDVTHLVVSVGGNDAIDCLGVFDRTAGTVADALDELADAADYFAAQYCTVVDRLRATGRRAVVCNIYEPRFPDVRIQRRAVTALALFNDIIVREAGRALLPVIDVRGLCDEAADYANPIEPSDRGGRKIASAIARALTYRYDAGLGTMLYR